MGIIELKYSNKTITTKSQILKVLKEEKLYWLIDSEVESAIIEIKNNTVIWHGGNYIFGNWNYGIFKDGEFNGIWENGIWENGQFYGIWKSGVR
jgi:hypothetical protein